MHKARLAALKDQGHGGALAGAHQIFADRADSQQAGNGDMVLVNVAVRQNQDVGTVAVGAVHINKQPVDGFFQIGVLVVADGQRHNFEAGHIHRLDLEQVGLGQDRVLDLQHLAVVGVFLQQVALRTDIDGGRGDDLLTQGIDRRVCDLREHLLEIFAQGRTGVAQNGQRGIAAHRPGRLAAVLRHRQQDRRDILIPVAERLLQLDKLLLGVGGNLLVGDLQVGQRDQIAVQPLAVGLAAGVVGLQLFIIDKLAFDGIDQQHLAGAQAVLADDLLSRQIQHADLAGKDQPPILCDIVAAGAQTIAVQHRAHDITVTEQDAGRAVPRLQHRGVILVKIAPLGVHRLVIVPRLGDRDHDGQRQIHAVHDHKFQRVIQLGRVRAALIDDGQNLRHIVLQIVGADGLLARKHRIHIAADRVDLAVVQNKAVGVCAVPAGGCVGGKAAVYHADGGFVVGVLQVGVEQPQLLDEEHALVHDGAAGQTADIGIGAGLLKDAAHHIQAAVKGDARL